MSAPMNPIAAKDLLEQLLSICSSLLTDNGRDLPDQVYISHDTPAADCCDLLTLTLNAVRASKRFPGRTTPTNNGAVPVMQIELALLRCYPTLKDGGIPPTPDELQTAAVELAVDGWVLWDGLFRHAIEGTLLPDDCDLVDLGELIPIYPSGGCAGYNIIFTVMVLA